MKVIIEGKPSAPAPQVKTVCIDEDSAGQRVDNFLMRHLKGVPKTHIYRMIRGGEVRVNKGRVSADTRLNEGDLVRVPPVRISERVAEKAQAMVQGAARGVPARDFTVLLEDEHLLVINKPAGLVVHPAPGNWSGTLMNGLLGHDPKAFDLPRAGIVHRLDKDTSGLMVVARSRTVMDALVRAIAAREVKRQYLAIGQGSWTGAVKCGVDAAIGRDPLNRLRMAAVDLNIHPGKPARTDFEMLSNGAQACLVHCTLHTGRTHQIRVHMAQLKHPLLGDALYGGSMGLGISRQALHAYRLAFEHPITRQPLSFVAELPADFSMVLNPLGLKYNQGIR